MALGRHYKIGKSLILDGTIKTFRDIFEYVPKTTVAKDIKMHFHTFQNRLDQPGTFSTEELTAIAELMDIDPLVIITMNYKQYTLERKPKKSRR